MPYVTAAEVRDYLGQLDGSQDVVLNKMAARAEAAVTRHLGFTFAGFTTATATITRFFGGERVFVPAHQTGTLSTITRLEDNVVIAATSYSAEPGDIYGATEVNRTLYLRGGWASGQYSIVGNWGFGLVPDDVKEVVIELVVNIWRSKDAGRFSDVVGVEGGNAVGYSKALTAYQKMTLDNVRRRYRGGIVV